MQSDATRQDLGEGSDLELGCPVAGGVATERRVLGTVPAETKDNVARTK